MIHIHNHTLISNLKKVKLQTYYFSGYPTNYFVNTLKNMAKKTEVIIASVLIVGYISIIVGVVLILKGKQLFDFQNVVKKKRVLIYWTCVECLPPYIL